MRVGELFADLDDYLSQTGQAAGRLPMTWAGTVPASIRAMGLPYTLTGVLKYGPVTDSTAVPSHVEHTLTGPADCIRCQLLRDNQHWMGPGSLVDGEPFRVQAIGQIPATSATVVVHDQASHARCPDDGTCHHECVSGWCFRVSFAAPLSGTYPGNQWPEQVRAEYGQVPPDPGQGGPPGGRGPFFCSACQSGEPFTGPLTQERVAAWMEEHLKTCPGWRDRSGDQPDPGGPPTLAGDMITRLWRYR
jgi:hypothetical protein